MSKQSKIPDGLVRTTEMMADGAGERGGNDRENAAEQERKLRLAAEFLASIVASSDDAIISKDLNGVITTWNRAAERIFGYTATEAVGQSITIIIPPERRQEESDILAQLRRGEKIDHFQTVRVRKDGTPVDISVTISPLKDPDGNVIGASKVARDITHQKRADEEVRRAHAQLQTAIASITDGLVVMDTQWRFTYFSQTAARIVGVRPEDMIGQVFWDLFPRAKEGKFYDEYHRAVETGEARHFEEFYPEPLNQWLECHCYPSEEGLTVYFHDVTSRKLTEEALSQHRERFELVAQAADVGFWFCDLPFDKLTWDKRVKDHFWLPEDAAVTIDLFYQRLHPDDRDRTRDAIAFSNANNTPYDIEYRTLASDGQQKWIRAIGRTFYDSAGRPKRFDGVTMDITDLKRAEEKSRKLAETLEAEVRSRTAELENRNLEVQAQAELLREFSQRLLRTQDEERRHIARELHDSAGQTLTVLGMSLAEIVQQSSALSPELAAEALQAEELVQQLHREIRTTSYLLHPPLLDEAGLSSAIGWYIDGLIERSGLEISLIISEELGRLPREMELVVFRLVQESLTNIHRHSGSKTASIRIGRRDDILKIEIRDEGKGISPERMAEIQTRGSGVGIRGMRERLRQVEGDLRIESGPSGTCIVVSIPVPKTSAGADINADRSATIRA